MSLSEFSKPQQFSPSMRTKWRVITLLATLILGMFCASTQAQQDSTLAGKVIWLHKNPVTGLTEKGKFVNGKRHGLWQYYNRDGRIVKREKFRHGVFWWAIYYHPNGKVAYSINRRGKIVKRADCGC